VDKVKRATDRMVTIIDGVITYATINASKQVLQKVDLRDVIKCIVIDL
jgi:phosphoglycerate-specific signal transduction histidine kinase